MCNLVENTEIYVMRVANEQHRYRQTTKRFYLEHHWGHPAPLKLSENFCGTTLFYFHIIWCF